MSWVDFEEVEDLITNICSYLSEKFNNIIFILGEIKDLIFED